jgi:hypothetical protein
MKKHKYTSYDGESSGVTDIVIEELGKGEALTTHSYNGKDVFKLHDHGNGFRLNDEIELDYSEASDFYIALTCLMHSGNYAFKAEISRKVKKISAKWGKKE